MDVGRVGAVLAREGVTIGPTIGEGTYARVFAAEVRASQGQPEARAIKVIDLTRLPKQLEDRFLPRELEAVARLRHRHVIHVWHVLRLGSLLALEMDRCRETLGDRLGHTGPSPAEEARRLFRQIVNAVMYCHGNGVAHRDLKAENVLLDFEDQVKICDFGYCFLDATNDTTTETFCGSLCYAPPEILQGHAYSPFKADVWSLGVLLFLICTTKLPFRCKHKNDLIIKQLTRLWQFPAKIVETIGPVCSDLVGRLLHPLASSRPDAEDVWNDAWLRHGDNDRDQVVATE